MNHIENQLNDYLLNAEKSIQEILFVPNAAHPVWSDNLEMLQLANKQILQPLGAFPNEHVYVFIGMHARTAITGKRDSIGFLITNFRILVQTDFSVIGTAKNALIEWFSKTQSSQEVSSKVWNDFTIKNKLTIEQESLSALHTSLKSVLEIVLPQLQQEDHLPDEIQKSSSLEERIKDLGLQGELKSYAENEKKYKAFSEKYNVSDIISGAVDKPFFGGVYGFVITKTGITSRDLMEDSITSSWQEIKDHPASIGDKKDVILAGQKTHIVPSYQKTLIPSFVTIINEIAKGEIHI